MVRSRQRQRCPEQHHQTGGQRPNGQCRRPRAAKQMLFQRHSEGRGNGGSSADGQGVEPGHHCGAAGEVALDQAQHQHISDGNARPCEHRSSKQQRQMHPAAQQGADADQQHGTEQRALDTKAPRQGRRRRRENAQAKNRKGGQETGARGTQTGVAHDVRQHHRQAAKHRTQVEGNQQQRQTEQQRLLALKLRGRVGGDGRLVAE